jgi:ketosteroid isomerase-like protein
VDAAIQKAVFAGDVAALDRLWSKELMFIGGDVRVCNKTERLADFRTQNRKVGAQQTDLPTVRVCGDTAIISYADWQEGVRDGKAFKNKSHLTRVYLKREGRWQLVHQPSALLERER